MGLNSHAHQLSTHDDVNVVLRGLKLICILSISIFLAENECTYMEREIIFAHENKDVP